MLILLRKMAWLFAWLGGLIALAVAVMTVVSVTQRALTTRPIQGDVEMVQMGIAISISLCLAWCQLRGANIIVDFFTQGMSPARSRMLDGVGCILIAVMYGLLAWRTSVGALAVRAAGETTMIRELPMWWAYASLAPGLALAAVIALVQAGQHFRNADASALTGAAQ